MKELICKLNRALNVRGSSFGFFHSRTLTILWIILLFNHTVAAVKNGRNSNLGNRPKLKRLLNEADALEHLSKILGMRNIPASMRNDREESRSRRSAPEYMTDLFNAVAYSDGISRTSSPHNADVVRGLTDKEVHRQMHFYFNVSHIKHSEKVLEAELHLYKQRLRVQRSLRTQNAHLVYMKLYEVLKENATVSSSLQDSDFRLLSTRHVSSYTNGWEVFKVRETIRQWANSTSPNYGFLVTMTSREGDHVNGSVLGLIQRSDEGSSKQPLLVVFSSDNTDKLQSSSSKLDITKEDEHYDPPAADSDLAAWRTQYIQFLNENHRKSLLTNSTSESLETKRRRFFMSPAVHERFVREVMKRRRRQVQKRHKKHHKSLRKTPRNSALILPENKVFRDNITIASSVDYNSNYFLFGNYSKSNIYLDDDLEYPSLFRRRRSKRNSSNSVRVAARKRRRSCQRHDMYVDFEKIGWSGWIISPKGYSANHCKGLCGFPLGQNQRPTNHATVQSIIQALKISPDVDTPCCVPNKLYSISLLYFDDDENVILKQYDEMVAASCGCH